MSLSLLSVGSAIVLALRSATFLAKPSTVAAAELVDAGLQQLRDSKPGSHESKQLTREIAKRLERNVAQAEQECEARGIDQQVLEGAVTSVEVIIERTGENPSAFVQAVQHPEQFAHLLAREAKRYRDDLEETAEQFFDKLLKAAADEIVTLAPWSPQFSIGALVSLLTLGEQSLEETKQIKALLNERIPLQLALSEQTLEKVAQIEAVLNELSPAHHPSGIIRFGSRPSVSTSFIARAEFQETVDRVVTGSSERTALVGMRGSGKSQLAAAIAARCEEEGWPLVAWIIVQSRDALLAELAELGNRLGVATGQDLTPEVLARRCLDALPSDEGADRLIVFDNVERLDDLAQLVPHGSGLRVLVTTTEQAGWMREGWEQIQIGVFDRERSVEYLLSRTDQDDSESASKLADKLGDLPLALAQAAADIRFNRCRIAEYCDRLERRTLEQAIRRLDGDNYPDSVGMALWMTVESTLEHIDATDRPAAESQLGALAMLAESGVPRRWLLTAFTNEDEAGRALAALINSSVCQLSKDQRTVSLHRLQAQTIRETWSEEFIIDAAASVLGHVRIEELPSNDYKGQRREAIRLAEQIRAITRQRHSRPLMLDQRTAAALAEALWHTASLGAPQEAMSLKSSVQALSDSLGAEHPSVLSAQNCLASAYESSGRLDEAIRLYERNCVDRERTLGRYHRDTLSSRNNLANAYELAGRLNRAIQLHTQNLADRERTLGRYHPDTLSSRNNLASAYESSGRSNEAIQMHAQDFAVLEQALGDGHPRTLMTRNNLATAYESAGEFTRAIELNRQNLKERERVLGPHHSDTLISRNNLASALRLAGEFDQAIRLFSENLPDLERFLGKDHPITLTTRNNLGTAFWAAGRSEEAIELLERNLAYVKRSLSASHEIAVTALNTLAEVYRATGRSDEADALFE